MEVLGRRVLEVYAASVDALVVQLDSLQGKGGGFRHGDEVGPRSHGGAVRPVQGLIKGPASHVKTESSYIYNSNISLRYRFYNHFHIVVLEYFKKADNYLIEEGRFYIRGNGDI